MALLTHRDYTYVNTLEYTELLDGLIFIEYLEVRHSSYRYILILI